MRRLLAATLLAFAAAGCGDGPRVEYAEQVTAEARALNAALVELGTTVSQSADAAAIGRRLEQQVGAVEAAAARLRRIEAPDGARDAHRKLAEGVEDYLRTMRSAAEVAKTGDLAKLTAALSAITDGSGAGARKIREARDELDAAGFAVSGT